MFFEEEGNSIEDLLAPKPGENRSGIYLGYAPFYDEIRAVRLRGYFDGDWARIAEGPDWDTVIRLITGALKTATKDLRLAVWLSEALAMTDGFAGVRDGIRLVRLMLDSFWDTLYPEIDEGDLEGLERIEARHVAEAIQYRSLDRTYWQ